MDLSTRTTSTLESVLDLDMHSDETEKKVSVQGLLPAVRSHHTMVPARSILKAPTNLQPDRRKPPRRTESLPAFVGRSSSLTSMIRDCSIGDDDDSMSNESDSPTTSSTRKPIRSVEFGSIEIRQHGLVLGDHPDCSYGPPVQLGWDCLERTVQHIEDYEFSRGPRRRKNNLAINYYERKSLLKNNAGLTDEEIKQATKKVSKDKMRRNLTKTLAPFHKVEDVMESSKRKLKRAAGSQC